MEGERRAGGLWCHEVLALLPDYMDGELGRDSAAAVVRHVELCDLCERFGSRYQQTLRSIRLALLSDNEFSGSASASQLQRRLRTQIDSSSGPP